MAEPLAQKPGPMAEIALFSLGVGPLPIVVTSFSNNLSFTFKVVSWWIPYYWTPSNFPEEESPWVLEDLFFHPLIGKYLTNMCTVIATSYLPGPISISSSMERTSVIFCGRERRSLQTKSWHRAEELIYLVVGQWRWIAGLVSWKLIPSGRLFLSTGIKGKSICQINSYIPSPRRSVDLSRQENHLWSGSVTRITT